MINKCSNWFLFVTCYQDLGHFSSGFKNFVRHPSKFENKQEDGQGHGHFWFFRYVLTTCLSQLVYLQQSIKTRHSWHVWCEPRDPDTRLARCQRWSTLVPSTGPSLPPRPPHLAPWAPTWPSCSPPSTATGSSSAAACRRSPRCSTSSPRRSRPSRTTPAQTGESNDKMYYIHNAMSESGKN